MQEARLSSDLDPETLLQQTALPPQTREWERMTDDPAAQAPDPAPKTREDLDGTKDAVPTAPMSGHAATDTAADAADEQGSVKATRKMPEPDSLGG